MLEKSSKMSVRQAMIEVAGSPPGYGEQPRWLVHRGGKDRQFLSDCAFSLAR